MLRTQKKLQNYLCLNRFLCAKFGLKNITELKEQAKLDEEGISENKKFYFTEALLALQALQQKTNITAEFSQQLDVYDENIQGYLKKINERRTPPIQLKYFQYLAVLFTEIYLDNFCNNFEAFFAEFAEFVAKCNAEEQRTENPFPMPGKQSMRKLAYWGATGSGKTLIMHVNYLQVQKYWKEEVENWLLITPGEGLSRQHMNHLDLSQIKYKVFDPRRNGDRWQKKNKDNVLQVIEITKIKKETASRERKKTIPVEEFGEKNILFVDEGHKGHSSETQAWLNLRKDLVRKNGFTFEYSATFGEITGRDEFFNEYAASIIFDYRYAYFYKEGYGKDYNIFNLKNPEDYGDEYFTFALLAYCQQLIFFQENTEQIKPFNFERPLMIFVGTSVTGKKAESDVFAVVKFLARFLNEGDQFATLIQKILTGQSNLTDANDQPIISLKLEYLKAHVREKGWNPEKLIKKLHETLFNAPNPGKLEFIELANAEGEIGLKIGADFFGVINIGNVSSFLKLIKDDTENRFIIGPKSNYKDSLFDSIKRAGSKINFLIGARRFIEGWDSPRVSSMGLLNVGRSEGTQIIQLFGRGVRLKGYNTLLKRNRFLKDEHRLPEDLEIPDQMTILETLNIFGLNADYMAVFRNCLNDNEIEVPQKVSLKIKPTIPDSRLSRPRGPGSDNAFRRERQIIGLGQPTPKVVLDLSSKVEVFESTKTRSIKADTNVGAMTIPTDVIDLIDLDRVYQELLAYKETKMYTNFYFDKQDLREKLYRTNENDKGYELKCNANLLKINPIDEIIKIRRIEDYIIQLFKNILDRAYGFEKLQWQMKK